MSSPADTIAALFGEKNPWEDPLSAHYMDGIRTEEAYLNRNKMVIYCEGCREWYHFERDPNQMLAAGGQVCPCGNSKLIGSTIISEGTWNPLKKIPKSKRR